jgi:SAM-dependent methyltransferase
MGVARQQSWDRAFDYLQLAAEQGSSTARKQLLLLVDRTREPVIPDDAAEHFWADLRGQISLERLLCHGERKALSNSPRIRVIEDFASPAECRWLVERTRDRLKPALVFNPEGKHVADPGRTNLGTEFQVPDMDLILEIIRTRIAAATNVPVTVFELTQVLHYSVGQEFKLHIDSFSPDNPQHHDQLGSRGQRIATFLIYLNEEFEGGETDFPKAKVRYRGKTGDAIFWTNVDMNGQPDGMSLHAGLPPSRGEKWVLSQWIRDRSIAAAAADRFPDERSAWESYWQTSGTSRCVPGADSIQSATAALWKSFAEQLPAGSYLIDLGSGTGAVLEEISRSRDDLKLMGVDFAQSLARGSRNYEIRVPVRMEELPFGDSSFDAITSQFGFEYSSMRQTAKEAARVLRAGGKLQFLIHNSGGAIVGQSRKRREALNWALVQSGCFEIAHQVTAMRKSVPTPTPPELRVGVEKARLTFPSEPVAVEILTALLQTLTEGERESAENTQRRLAWLQGHARHELAIIDALLRVAQDDQGILSIVEMLRTEGLQIATPNEVVDESTGVRFAWLLCGSKPL